ncbi:hypothetical protein HGRIS_013215 [Hohenbuehelia grisea]|uniref:Prokaryotic-type class I peptide chain release factors domain-containing protein n=1 Tax=Hohenbuehelia grisea TaxID=104357 RepID=A0ABR3IUP6_9AGAR
MSITPTLRAAARSAYRDVVRAATSTFSGDKPVLLAFRQKMRHDALQAQAITSPTEYEANTALTREIASILRRNIVQATKVSTEADSEELWRLRITKDTELGSNDSIKDPPPMPSARSSRRKQTKCCSQPIDDLRESTNTLNFSALKRAHKEREIPVLSEEDLEESFVRGSGPGGQAINKTMSNVQLLHKPTGIRVTCQDSRSLELNRRLARRLLVEKLDKIRNPGLSKGELQRAKQRERERQRRKKAKKKKLAKLEPAKGSEVVDS